MTFIIFILLSLPFISPTLIFPLFNIMDIIEVLMAFTIGFVLIRLIKNNIIDYNMVILFLINYTLIFSNRLDLLYIKSLYLTFINSLLLFISTTIIYFKLKRLDKTSSHLFFIYVLYTISFLFYVCNLI